MKRLKLFFACLLMAVLSIGQVWGADVTTSWTASSGALGSGIGSGTINTTVSGSSTTQSWSYTRTLSSGTSYTGWTSNCVQLGKNGGVENLTLSTSNIPGTIKSVAVECASYQGKHNVSITVGETEYLASTATASWTTVNAKSGTGTSSGTITISFTGGTRALYIKSITVVYNNDAPSTPAVSADPEEVEDVPVAGVTNQTIDLTYENITGYVTEVSVHPNADGSGTLSPAWLTASVSDADDYATITYTVSANDGAARTAYIKVYTTDGDKEAETIIPVSQAKYSAPTGTFELFSGDLAEGDYVITHASANAIKAEINSDRFAAIEVSPSADIITNPDESIVWHIAQSGGYWTIYNVAAGKYAASTGAKNKGALLDDGTDDKALWSLSGTYDFINKQNTASSVNATLRYNYQNALNTSWACYASGTGSALVLYKKQVAGQPATPTFSVAGGNYESAQTVEISCETVGATIHYTLDGTKPTSSSPTYSTALNISSTTTVKAVAIKDDIESTVASATYTIVVWQTVDEIWSSITSEGPTNANVWGYVSQANVGGYNNNYYISVDGSLTANQLEIYKGDNAGNTVAVGDKVHVNGDLTIFNEIKEFKQNTGVIVHYAAKGDLQSVAVSGTPTKTEYAANEDFDPAGLKVYGTYANGFVGEITEGITWGNDLTDGKVTENTTVHVTATVSGITNDPAYDVPVTVAAKTLLSIAVDVDSYTIYTGEALPEPTVTATFSEGEPENVSAFAVYDSESVFNTATIDDPDPQTITVSYTFGGETKTTTYTVSVQDYENANDAPYSVTEALHIITAAIGNTESAREIVVTGTVSEENISNNKNRYKISDSTNELLVYAGKGFNNENFTNTNYPKVGDVVKVKGKVINYNNNTPEFASGKSYLLSQVRPATIAIENVASFEVGATDLTENDLVITTASDGDITFVSGDDAVATIEANAIHAVAPGTVTITANLAATENDDALNYAAASTTFSVTVVAPATKYAITFSGNGATGGDAPEFASEAAAGANITLPANSYTKTGHTFTGWKVYDENEDEVTVTANAFEMPASPVTIKAQWAEIPVWAYTYTSNVTLTGAKVKFYGEETEYDAVKAGTGKVAGSVDITIPAQATKLHFHAYGWNDETVGLTVTAPAGVTVSPATEISINSNDGIASNSPFTLAEGSTPMTDAYYVVELSGNDDEIELTFTATSGKRFVLFGVNQEGGIVPELQSLAVSGDLENKTYEAGATINPAGLTVMGTYTLGGTPQAPVDVTDQVEDWLYDALQVGDETVTISAKIGTVTSAGYEISGLTVTDPTPRFETNPASYINFGSKEQGATITARDLEVTLVNVSNASVEITGDGKAAFSVDEDALTGNATLHVSASSANVGTFAATLTISDEAGVAADKEISLSLTITEPETPEAAVSTTSKWVVATAADLVDGAEVLITGVKDDVTYAMGGQNKNNRAAVAASVDGEDVLTPGENTMSFTLVAQETEGVFALRTSNGKYLYAAASGDNYMKTQGNVDVNAQWTISATSAVAESSSNRNVMQFNGGSSLFSCYNTASQSAIQFYVPKPAVTPDPVYTEVRNGLTEGWYYTMCLDKAVTAVQGGSIWRVLSKAANDKDVILEEVTGNLDAGRPYIFRAAASTLEVAYTGDAVLAPVTEGNNGLVGSFTEEPLAQNPNHYIIYNNALYYVNSDNVKVGEHRAYLDMTYVPAYSDEPQQGSGAPRRRVVMTVHGEQTATGMENVQGDNVQCTKVLIDGQMYILRGEKLFDATGRLVK